MLLEKLVSFKSIIARFEKKNSNLLFFKKSFRFEVTIAWF